MKLAQPHEDTPMMRYKFLTTLICFMVISSFAQATQLKTFGYAYIYRGDTGDLGILLLSPSENTSRQIDIPSDIAGLQAVAPSIKNEWIAFTARNTASYELILMNILTSEIRRLTFEGVGLYNPEGLKGSPQNIVWSPDGKYLALNLGDNTDIKLTVSTYLYSLAENTLIELHRDSIQATRLAWSNDGRYLAAAGYRCKNTCASSLDLESQLDIFDVTTQSWSSTIPLTAQIPGALGDAGLCELAWSPDNTYISLIATCDSLDYAQYQEVYLIAVQKRTILRLTDFTYRQNIDAQNWFRVANYRTRWLDSDSLFISAIHGIGAENKAETLVYDPSTQTFTPLFDGFATAIDWYAQTQRLVIQSGSMTDARYGMFSSIRMLNLLDLQAGREISVEPLSISTEVCGLEGSPDGHYLVYTTPNSSNLCSAYTQEIGVVNMMTSEKSPIVMKTEVDTSEIIFILPIGWMETYPEL